MSKASELIEAQIDEAASVASTIESLEKQVGKLWTSMKKVPGYGDNSDMKKVVKFLIDAELQLESAKNASKKI